MNAVPTWVWKVSWANAAVAARAPSSSTSRRRNWLAMDLNACSLVPAPAKAPDRYCATSPTRAGRDRVRWRKASEKDLQVAEIGVVGLVADQRDRQQRADFQYRFRPAGRFQFA